MPGGVPGAGGMGGQAGADADREEQMAQQEEMKRQMLSQILDSDARERCTFTGRLMQCRASLSSSHKSQKPLQTSSSRWHVAAKFVSA